MILTVLDYLDRITDKFPDKYVFIDKEKRMTYAEFRKEVLHVAEWILSKVGCQHRPIIVKMKNTCNALVAFWGIAYSGNIYVPVDNDIPKERWEQIVEALNPIMVIDVQNTGCQEMIQFQNILMDEVESKYVEKVRNNIVDTDPLYILFTSGSTGIPKGVTISHAAVIDFTEESSNTMDFSEKEIFLNQAPFYFDASVPDIYCTVRNGATLHMVDHKWFTFPIKILDYIEKEKINAIFWVPSALVTVANLKALGKRDISSLKKIMFCGEVMPTKQYNQWKRQLPESIFVNYYGPCETTYASAYYIIDREFADSEPLPIGKAAINTRIVLIDEKGIITKKNKIGEIYIGGIGVALGYYNDKMRTEKVFVQNPAHDLYRDILYKTGDLAHYNQNGEICFDGRRDYQIKHMGYRIELEAIEAIARSIKNVEQVACIYNEKKKEIILYYIGSEKKEKILDILKNRLQSYMMPSIIVSLKNFPMNQNGKIDRIALVKMCDEKEA